MARWAVAKAAKRAGRTARSGEARVLSMITMASTPTTAIELLLPGNYCLWAGAGITTQLASASSGPPLGWETLVLAMEKEAGVLVMPKGTSYPERLDICFRQLDTVRFQRVIRKTVYEALSDRIVKAAKASCKLPNPIPTQVSQIAQLGMLANPIVNFNIETLTSEVLAGPHNLRCFLAPTDLPVRIEKRRASSMFPDGPQFFRSVYHPHGSIDVTGQCVLTSRNYRELQSTLAFQLATHQAFDSDLVIVGMSLDDIYLRRQLGKFRNQIRNIHWFTDVDIDGDRSLKRWTRHYGINVIPVKWPEFWSEVGRILPAPKPQELEFRWTSILFQAISKGASIRMVEHIEKTGMMDPARIAAHRQAAELRGESMADADDVKKTEEFMTEVLPVLLRHRFGPKATPSLIAVP